MRFNYAVVLGLLLVTVNIQPPATMSHEEEVVRTTYARLSYAAQVNEIHNLWQEKGREKQIDNVKFQLRIANTLRFELSDFKVGAISDILSVKYKDLVTQPSSATGDSLEVGAGRIGSSDKNSDGNVTESSSTIAQVRWIPSHDIGENWDIAFGTLYPLTKEAGKHQRYADFLVKVTFQGRSRTYRAMFLFGPEGSAQNIVPVDTIININGGALSRFLTEDAYPGTLIEGGLGNKDPMIHEWLKTQQTTQGETGALHCDPSSGRCQITEQDFRKLKPMKYFPAYSHPAQARLVRSAFHPLHAMRPFIQSDCSVFSKTFPPLAGFQPDQQFHLDDTLHSVTVLKNSACTYTNGTAASGNCDTQCTVTTPVFTNENAGPFSLSSFCHVSGKDIDNTHATATAVGAGAQCGGAGGGAFDSCFGCLCNVAVKVTKGPVEITIASSGFFKFKDGLDNNCPAQKQPPPPTPTPTPIPPPPVSKPGQPCDNDPTAPGGGGNQPDVISGCSPIIIDLTGSGFELTSAANGVKFDIANTGIPIQISWTANANNAFLALDRDGSGSITSGAELFGNFTSQPSTSRPNGFLALAVYDDPANGGNGDGIIDSRDQIFSRLRLWVDANHDGICQPGELHLLPDLGVYAIGLDYSPSGRTDSFGNVFRYSAKVNPGLSGKDNDVGKKAYDVFLVTQ